MVGLRFITSAVVFFKNMVYLSEQGVLNLDTNLILLPAIHIYSPFLHL